MLREASMDAIKGFKEVGKQMEDTDQVIRQSPIKDAAARHQSSINLQKTWEGGVTPLMATLAVPR